MYINMVFQFQDQDLFKQKSKSIETNEWNKFIL